MGAGREATIDWVTDAIEGRGDAESAADHVARHVLDQFGAGHLVEMLAKTAGGRRVAKLGQGPVPASVTLELVDDSSEPRLHLECVLDRDDKLLGLSSVPAELADIVVRTVATAELSPADRARVQALFAESYEQANPSYLDASLATLRWITMATLDGDLVGFALGERRLLELPRLGATNATLAGLACVDSRMRRRGLFRRLSNLVLVADGVPDRSGGPVLGAGRMAHPASYRAYRGQPTLVPTAGSTPTPFQQEVGAVVARAYGVADFDPETFVCRGKGTPIGYPRMVQEVEPEEWDVFEHVDRDRGDALLAIIWQPTAPDGWNLRQ